MHFMYLIPFLVFGPSKSETIETLRIFGQLHRVFLLGDEENQVHHAPSSFCSVSSASLYSSKSLVFTSASSPYWRTLSMVIKRSPMFSSSLMSRGKYLTRE